MKLINEVGNEIDADILCATDCVKLSSPSCAVPIYFIIIFYNKKMFRKICTDIIWTKGTKTATTLNTTSL